jgi:nucleotide-binding universal stress UspA family protein
MKILIAYDGSEYSDAAIVDLRRAGLPAVAEALVLSVADVPAPVAAAPYGDLAAGSGVFPSIAEDFDGPCQHHLQEAEDELAHAADRLRADFPGWQIKTEAWVDAAASAIIRKAHGWNPDLIVMGSHGCSGFSRLVLGSVSQQVLHHADCAVRISRHRLVSQQREIRLLIGVDGSNCAAAAVKAAAARNWPAGTQIRVVGVIDTRIAVATATGFCGDGALPVAFEEESTRRMSKATNDAADELAKGGLRVTAEVLDGIPCQLLLAEAEKWAADCIFVGARGLSGLQRLLLGSVSTAVASRAHCSVEVIRSKPA